jgi:uncharacterized membrane protein HdeD (DUF308 family)
VQVAKEDGMIRVLINNWWLLGLRGIFALLFAVLAFSLRPVADSVFTRPIAHTATVIVFGLLALAAGVSTILASFRRAGRNRSHLLLWDGIAVSVVGLVTLLGSKLTLVRFVYFIAAWAIVIGVLELQIARSLRRHIPDEWSLTVAGAASIILGAYRIFERSDQGVSLLPWLGVYAGFSAITMLALSFRLYSLRSSIGHFAEDAEISAPQ